MWSFLHESVYQWLQAGCNRSFKSTIFLCISNLEPNNLMSIRYKPYRKHNMSQGNLIFFSLRYKNLELFLELLRKCCFYKLSLKTPCYINGDTILHAAIRYNFTSYFYNSCYSDPFHMYVNIKNSDNQSPLHIACQLGDKQSIILLFRSYLFLTDVHECLKYCIEELKYDVIDFVFDYYSNFFSENSFERYLSYAESSKDMTELINKYNPYL